MTARVVEVDVGGRTRSIAVEPLPATAGHHRFRLTQDGRVQVVDARRVDGETLSLVYVEGGVGSHEAVVLESSATDREGLTVHVKGSVVEVVVDRARRWVDGGGSDSAGGNQLLAPMPGKVVRFLVQEGDEVAAKQGVVIVEAMKMENEITAPRAGRVAAVRVSEGASVDAGTVLVVID